MLMNAPTSTSKSIRIVFLGDLNGGPGRTALRHGLPYIHSTFSPHCLVANGENLKNGSGITPDLYAAIRKDGLDGVTLGDHVFRDRKVLPLIENAAEPISRPANLSDHAPGKKFFRIEIPTTPGQPPVTGGFFSLLGRVGMGLPANDPFAAADEILASIPAPGNTRPIIFVDAHMEATAEKAALAHHLDGKVTAVLGTHTHIPTADARVLPGGTAFQTDVGMCGPYDSIIGRDPEPVVRHMRTSVHTPYTMGQGGERISGACIEVDISTSRARSIRSIVYPDFDNGINE